MENVIKQLVEKDRLARESTEQAQRKKMEAKREITESADRLKAEYLAQARARIERNNENERTIFEQNWKRRRKAFDEQAAAWHRLDNKSRDAWVDQIVKEVLK